MLCLPPSEVGDRVDDVKWGPRGTRKLWSCKDLPLGLSFPI